MKRFIASLVMGMAVSSLVLAPARAADAPDSDQYASGSQSERTECTRTSDSESPFEKAVLLPARTVGFASALALGTPVAVVRASAEKSRDVIEGLLQSSDTESSGVLPAVVAGIVGLPVGILVGAPEGLYHGCKNAINNCGDHPFSKEAYSLGDGDVTAR